MIGLHVYRQFVNTNYKKINSLAKKESTPRQEHTTKKKQEEKNITFATGAKECSVHEIPIHYTVCIMAHPRPFARYIFDETYQQQQQQRQTNKEKKKSIVTGFHC